jgi:hypothetical protein
MVSLCERNKTKIEHYKRANTLAYFVGASMTNKIKFL